MIERKVQFRLGSPEVVTAMQLASSRKIRVPIPLVLVFGAAVAVVSVLMFGSDDSFVSNFLIPLLIFLLIVVALIQYVVLPWQARRHAQQSVALRDEITAEWDDQGMTLSGAHGQARMAWSEFHRWSESPAVILLYQSDMFFNAVPKSALTDEQTADIVDRLKAEGVKKR